MGFYQEVSKGLQKDLKQYIKFNEKARMSFPMEIKKTEYREIVFSKKFLSRLSGEVIGNLFLDKQYNPVTDKEILKRLARISYFGEILFDEESNISLHRAFKLEGDLKKEEEQYTAIKKGLSILQKEKVIKDDEKLRIQEIIDRFYSLRKKNNETMKSVVEKSKEITKNNEFLSERLIDELYYGYVQVLSENFDKIKFLKQGEDVFYDILDKLKKGKKKIKVRLSAENKNYLSKLEYSLNYYIKLLSTYESVMHMSRTQYEKELKNIEKKNINERFKTIRNI